MKAGGKTGLGLNKLKHQGQWGVEYRECLDFEWSKVVQMLNVFDFEWHSKTDQIGAILDFFVSVFSI